MATRAPFLTTRFGGRGLASSLPLIQQSQAPRGQHHPDISDCTGCEYEERGGGCRECRVGPVHCTWVSRGTVSARRGTSWQCIGWVTVWWPRSVPVRSSYHGCVCRVVMPSPVCVYSKDDTGLRRVATRAMRSLCEAGQRRSRVQKGEKDVQELELH
jgi:hypothetical protein